MSDTLPGTPGPKLQAAYDSVRAEAKPLLREHLLGGTSAEWLAGVLRDAGCDISATSIKVYRRSLRQGVIV